MHLGGCTVPLITGVLHPHPIHVCAPFCKQNCSKKKDTACGNYMGGKGSADLGPSTGSHLPAGKFGYITIFKSLSSSLAKWG